MPRSAPACRSTARNISYLSASKAPHRDDHGGPKCFRSEHKTDSKVPATPIAARKLFLVMRLLWMMHAYVCSPVVGDQSTMSCHLVRRPLEYSLAENNYQGIVLIILLTVFFLLAVPCSRTPCSSLLRSCHRLRCQAVHDGWGTSSYWGPQVSWASCCIMMCFRPVRPINP
jgi:hypothetical protein